MASEMFRPLRSIGMATLFLTACSGSSPFANKNEPTATDVDTFLETKLPPEGDVEDVVIESFIDPISKEGRVSAKVTLVINEPLYRPANPEEIDARYGMIGLGQYRERALYVRNQPPFVTETIPKGNRYPLAVELAAAKRVEGWSFQITGGEDPQALHGSKPLEKFGENAVPLDGEAAQAYFAGLQADRQGVQQRDEALQQAFRKRFPNGKVLQIRFTHPNNDSVRIIRFVPTAEPEVTAFDNGTHAIALTGAVEYVGDGGNMTCSQHGGPTFRSGAGQITGTLGRAEQDGVMQPYYDLELAFWDPAYKEYCSGGDRQKSRFQNGRVTPGNGLYYTRWEVL